mmetsp:Transcript_37532/g.95923  ORF Transcript_37532/g.95923 Transcript_37532/m.95923 type:complete len:246 (-) Transcript_37532:957-1694(-)
MPTGHGAHLSFSFLQAGDHNVPRDHNVPLLLTNWVSNWILSLFSSTLPSALPALFSSRYWVFDRPLRAIGDPPLELELDPSPATNCSYDCEGIALSIAKLLIFLILLPAGDPTMLLPDDPSSSLEPLSGPRKVLPLLLSGLFNGVPPLEPPRDTRGLLVLPSGKPSLEPGLEAAGEPMLGVRTRSAAICHRLFASRWLPSYSLSVPSLPSREPGRTWGFSGVEPGTGLKFPSSSNLAAAGLLPLN